MWFSKKWIISACLSLLMTQLSFAANAKFFSSNNTHEIDLQTAYARLNGAEQQALQTSISNILQKNHLEQGRVENILGTYRMAADHQITANNTEVFDLSSYQKLSRKQLLGLAQQLAVALKQESVAVYIPQNSSAGEIELRFAVPQPGIDETVAMLRTKLPAAFNAAYSLHLLTPGGNYDAVKVSAVEWLGSKLQAADVEKAFPDEKVLSHDGEAFLVYKDGKTEAL